MLKTVCLPLLRGRACLFRYQLLSLAPDTFLKGGHDRASRSLSLTHTQASTPHCPLLLRCSQSRISGPPLPTASAQAQSIFSYSILYRIFFISVAGPKRLLLLCRAAHSRGPLYFSAIIDAAASVAAALALSAACHNDNAAH
jgi:hypothetical protein